MSRYDRQIKAIQFGEQGQVNLSKSKFLIIGAGALGSTISEMLARSGAGEIIVCDMDIVSLSNLHRQSLYDETDVHQYELKVDAVKRHLSRINSEVTVTAIPEEITSDNLKQLIEKFQPTIVIDGTDNFITRYVINDICHQFSTPWVYGACLGSKGTVYAIDYSVACLRCILPDPPDTGQNCSLEGILPQTAHLTASLQVSEVMKYIAEGHFSNHFITFDSFSMDFKSTDATFFRNNNCKTCATHDYPAIMRGPRYVTKMCYGKYSIKLPSDVFYKEIPYIVKETPSFKLIKVDHVTVHLLKDGRIIIYDVYSSEEAKSVIFNLFSISV
ncbi:Molybdopterin-synthase adenylyltransferase [Macrococcoides canis]|uniref:Molybdopterin-synthase adenylyltransferase n=1 Tax=Macrococcoides canis TaxID=1855823 RepID=A0A1W7A8C1_9STAP|nr:HesA/MoeB/ThiF family protein [Macrococcus canis]ARQ05895.1 Molybdopterin-synthase adenylyltransferase [Macrococcus canis]